MPDIQAFRGIRYDLGHVGSLSDVIAPPYDVIGPPLQDALYKKHPANVVRLILNREEPGDDDTSNRYSRAAQFLRNWRSEGVLGIHALNQPTQAPRLCRGLRLPEARLPVRLAVNGRQFTRDGLRAAIRDAKNTTTPIELLTKDGEFYKTFRADCHTGERYPDLERDASQPDLLSAIGQSRAR